MLIPDAVLHELIIREPYTGSSFNFKISENSSRVLKDTDVNLSLVQTLLEANSTQSQASLSPAKLKLQIINPRRSQTIEPSPHRVLERANLEFPSEVARVASHQAEDSQSDLPSMSLLVWSSPVEVIKNSLPQQQPRIYFPRRQLRCFYLQPPQIHLSSAR